MLTQLEFFHSDGALFTDMTNAVDFGWNPDDWLYRGTAMEVINLQHFTQFSVWDEPPATYTACATGEYAEMTAFYDDGMDISYIWRNNNILHYMQKCAPRASIQVAAYPPTTDWVDYPERNDGAPLPGNARIFWFDLSNEDGTDKDYEALLNPGGLEAPDQPGQYLLIIRDGSWWHVLVVQVV